MELKTKACIDAMQDYLLEELNKVFHDFFVETETEIDSIEIELSKGYKLENFPWVLNKPIETGVSSVTIKTKE